MKQKLMVLLLVTLLISPIYSQTIARWYTSMGDFEIKLREDYAPITVNNFVTLTNTNFYDGLVFHRVIDDFMIQDGCPLGNGSGGPGYTFDDEFNSNILYDEPGVIGMANSGPNTNGSQYFITLVPTNWLNYNYSAFGNVIQGMDIVQNIGDVPTSANDHPVDEVYIDSIRIMTPQFFGISPESDSLDIEAGNDMVFTMFSYENNLEYNWYFDDELQDETTDLFMPNFPENGIHIVKAVVSNGDYEYERLW
ncbi:MAG: peptidylprolyl isomerase, partial [Candidatus Cloacimonadota bacterium]|nr:peptidylprolyl isomerase [Candidatus Cloacimonadota bacterium]